MDMRHRTFLTQFANYVKVLVNTRKGVTGPIRRNLFKD